MFYSCSLPASTVEFFYRFDKKIPRKNVIQDMNIFTSIDDMSVNDIIIMKLSSMLNSSNMHLLPYLVYKVWYGDKIMYDDEIERQMSDILSLRRFTSSQSSSLRSRFDFVTRN